MNNQCSRKNGAMSSISMYFAMCFGVRSKEQKTEGMILKPRSVFVTLRNFRGQLLDMSCRIVLNTPDCKKSSISRYQREKVKFFWPYKKIIGWTI